LGLFFLIESASLGIFSSRDVWGFGGYLYFD
jgi:hypothetical protein